MNGNIVAISTMAKVLAIGTLLVGSLAVRADDYPMAMSSVPTDVQYVKTVQEALTLFDGNRWCGQWEEKGRRKTWCETVTFSPVEDGASEARGKVRGLDAGEPYGGNARLKVNEHKKHVVLIDRAGNSISLATGTTDTGDKVLYYIYSADTVYPAVVGE